MSQLENKKKFVHYIFPVGKLLSNTSVAKHRKFDVNPEHVIRDSSIPLNSSGNNFGSTFSRFVT